ARLHLISAGATLAHGGPLPLRLSQVDWDLAAGPGARLAHMPDPWVLMPGATVSQNLNVEVAQGASLVLFDGFCRHDPQACAAGGSWASALTIRRPGGAILLRDRQV